MIKHGFARMALRQATLDQHERVDHAFSRFALGEPAGYKRFLEAQAGAFLPLEAAVDASITGGVVDDWPSRRRSELLRADLADLGVAIGPPKPAAPLLATPELLGTVYVLEGSRLGGAMLVRRVPAESPKRFLGASESALWRSFIALLDRHLDNDQDILLAVGAAKSAFARFERSALNN